MPFKESVASNSGTAMSELLRKSIINAYSEERLKVGLIDCIEHLYSCDPIKVLAVALTDGSDDLISQTILEAYCYEQKIPFLKTESNLLRRFLRCSSKTSNELHCVLIMRPSSFVNYQDETDLIRLIRVFEMNNETLVIFNNNSSFENNNSNTNNNNNNNNNNININSNSSNQYVNKTI